MSILVTGIGELVTNDASLGEGQLGTVTDAALVVDAGAVAWVGRATDAPDADTRIEVQGRAVIPGFVDSHTHLVFAGDRAAEFEARMSGAAYDGGGIASTVSATRAADDAELLGRLTGFIAEMRGQGTTTVEVKGGYGLTVEDEARALRLARQVTPETTFLGAHVVPPEYVGRIDEYVALVTGPMLAACAPHAR
ncbi:MAG: amidohydrolase family protein, partial [Actinobacteria bacterium]|nr:amidohydrolase family protein [Actinomycetota bacterium]